jgi:hypothetical protein
MKMQVKLLLALFVAITMSASGALARSVPGTLRVGAARMDITPPSTAENPALNEFAHEKLYLRAWIWAESMKRFGRMPASVSPPS